MLWSQEQQRLRTVNFGLDSGEITRVREGKSHRPHTVYQDLGCQQDQPGLDIAAYETLHCLHPRMVFECKPDVMAPFGGDFDLARLLVPTDQAKLLQDGG